MAITNLYHKRFVLFMDILGFKELVKHQQEQQIYVALEASKNLAGSTLDDDFYGFKSAVFSDCIVMSQVFDDERLDHGNDNSQHIATNFIKRAGELFWCFMQRGVLVRGGIAYGDMHHEIHRVFGPALVEAYELENGRAIYPRIILSDSVIQKLKAGKSEDALPPLKTDADGEKFVDVMDHFYVPESSGDCTPPDLSPYKKHLHSFKMKYTNKYINENEDTLHPRVKQKIHWLKTYITSSENSFAPENQPHQITTPGSSA